MVSLKKNLLVGILVAVLICVGSILLNFSFSYMGVSDKSATALVVRNYKYFLIIYHLKILLAYAGIGLIVGWFAWLLKISKRIPNILFHLFFWVMFWARAVQIFPQLFLPQLFNRGGFFKGFQLFLTDVAPIGLPEALFVTVILGIALRKRRVVFGLAIILAAAGFIIKFKHVPVQAESEGAPNVLIFGTDSLRPQSISFNGYLRPTPNIDEIFSRGVHFRNTMASVARTFPVWTSVLTSTLPLEHGIRTMYPTESDLKRRWLTLVDILNRKRYFTAVSSDFAGDMFSRADYGFQRTKVPRFRIQNILKQRSLEIHYFLLGFLVNPAGERIFPEMSGMPYYLDPHYVTENTKGFIREAVGRKQPFFILSFSSNNHFPYVSRQPYYRLYASKHYAGKHKYCLSSDMLRSFLGETMSRGDRQQIVDLYDGATRLFDDNLGEILRFLKKCRLDRSTIVIVVSDHGENLLDDGYGCGHGDHLRGPFANDMLLGIRSPFENFGGRKIDQTVRDIDIAPTILSLLDIPAPSEFRGRDLLPFARGAPFSGLPVYMETGIWYTTGAPFIPDRIRAPYPAIMEMLDVQPRTGEILLKDQYAKTIIEAKHRAWRWNEQTYIYMPGENRFVEEFYVHDQRLRKEDITDPGFLKSKEKIVGLFPNQLYLDPLGMIREK